MRPAPARIADDRVVPVWRKQIDHQPRKLARAPEVAVVRVKRTAAWLDARSVDRTTVRQQGVNGVAIHARKHEILNAAGEHGDTVSGLTRGKFVRRDQRKVADLWVIDALAQPRPKLETYRYAMPGEANVTQYEIDAFDVASKAMTKIKADRFNGNFLFTFGSPAGTFLTRFDKFGVKDMASVRLQWSALVKVIDVAATPDGMMAYVTLPNPARLKVFTV